MAAASVYPQAFPKMPHSRQGRGPGSSHAPCWRLRRRLGLGLRLWRSWLEIVLSMAEAWQTYILETVKTPRLRCFRCAFRSRFRFWGGASGGNETPTVCFEWRFVVSAVAPRVSVRKRKGLKRSGSALAHSAIRDGSHAQTALHCAHMCSQSHNDMKTKTAEKACNI